MVKKDYSAQIIKVSEELIEKLKNYPYPKSVTEQINPLEYAWEAHCQYLEKFANSAKKNLFLGMNPGPFGMVQTGIPFGEVASVRDWLKIDSGVNIPLAIEGRVKGFVCTRSEVSGRRLWGYFRQLFPLPEDFFSSNFVLNYCPLAFFQNNKNITPDKFLKNESQMLYEVCDQYLLEICKILEIKTIIAVGQFAEKCALRVFAHQSLQVIRIIHPSPANPLANSGWESKVAKVLHENGVKLSSK